MMCEWDIERTPVKQPNTDEAIKELSIKLTAAEIAIERFKEDKEKLQGEYNKIVTNQFHKDYQVENQKKVIENLHKTLERYETENKAMRALLQLWI